MEYLIMVPSPETDISLRSAQPVGQVNLPSPARFGRGKPGTIATLDRSRHPRPLIKRSAREASSGDHRAAGRSTMQIRSPERPLQSRAFPRSKKNGSVIRAHDFASP